MGREPWLHELLDRLGLFDADRDGALSRPELLDFIVRGLGEPAEHAAEEADFFLHDGPEADANFLRQGNNGSTAMALGGLAEFYARASVHRPADVRRNLQALGLAGTVPERPEERPHVGAVLCTIREHREGVCTIEEAGAGTSAGALLHTGVPTSVVQFSA